MPLSLVLEPFLNNVNLMLTSTIIVRNMMVEQGGIKIIQYYSIISKWQAGMNQHFDDMIKQQNSIPVRLAESCQSDGQILSSGEVCARLVNRYGNDSFI